MAALITPAEREVLTAAGTGAAEQVTAYDFRRPDRLSREHVRALQVLHERCARTMSTSFSAYLRTTVTLSVAAIEQLAYDEFLRSAADPTAFYALGIAPFDELGALEISPAVAFALIDRMLGGPGVAAPAARPLTEIEQNVVDTVVKLFLEGVAEAWKPVANLAFSIRARETKPQMLQVAAPNDLFVAVGFRVQVGEASGPVTLCIPAGVVESANAQFAQAWPRQRRERGHLERTWIAEHIARARVAIVPEIRTSLSTSAVLALAPGEVLALPHPVDQPIDVYAGGVKKFRGRLASDATRLVVSIEQRRAAPPRVSEPAS